MRLEEFENEILLALYHEYRLGHDLISLGKLAQEYSIEVPRGFLIAAHDDMKSRGMVTGPLNRRIEEMTAASITGSGIRYIENNFPDRLRDFHNREEDDSVLNISDVAEAEVIPASDRMVRLDHNSAPYKQVSVGLDELYEELRTTNDLDTAPEERERLLFSLDAARKLWEAAQLKVIQIEVGILLAIEDASGPLRLLGKAIGAALLVDAIKAIIKHSIGLEF